MDSKSKEIYEKIENFLEERKGRERRTDKAVESAETEAERRQRKDRRQSATK